LAILCLERLADLSTGMNNIHTTMGWAGIFLVLALRSKDKLATMKAFRCFGQILLWKEMSTPHLVCSMWPWMDSPSWMSIDGGLIAWFKLLISGKVMETY
jgi:hypothetical protein